VGDARPKHGSFTSQRQRRAVRLAALAMALALPVTACTRTTSTPDRPTTGTPLAEQRAGADGICTRFAVAALSSDTAIDRGSADARQRAAEQFGTSALVAQFTGQGADPEWAGLLAHEAYVAVSTAAVADDPPPIGLGEAAAGVVARRTAIGESGWRERLPDIVVYCTLVIGQQGWKVDTVSFSEDGSATSGSAQASP
jgi:hypothetical protein